MQLYDLCECYQRRHVSTLKYNIPYQLAKGLKRMIQLSKYPKGTYFVITKNGESPIKPKTCKTTSTSGTTK